MRVIFLSIVVGSAMILQSKPQESEANKIDKTLDEGWKKMLAHSRFFNDAIGRHIDNINESAILDTLTDLTQSCCERIQFLQTLFEIYFTVCEDDKAKIHLRIYLEIDNSIKQMDIVIKRLDSCLTATKVPGIAVRANDATKDLKSITEFLKKLNFKLVR